MHRTATARAQESALPRARLKRGFGLRAQPVIIIVIIITSTTRMRRSWGGGGRLGYRVGTWFYSIGEGQRAAHTVMIVGSKPQRRTAIQPSQPIQPIQPKQPKQALHRESAGPAVWLSVWLLVRSLRRRRRAQNMAEVAETGCQSHAESSFSFAPLTELGYKQCEAGRRTRTRWTPTNPVRE